MASTLFWEKWWLPHLKWLQMSMNGSRLMVGTSSLDIHLSKSFTILLRIFVFQLHQKNCLHYVVRVPLIKHINNLFVSLVSKVMLPLN
jgi:hypothetical protein